MLGEELIKKLDVFKEHTIKLNHESYWVHLKAKSGSVEGKLSFHKGKKSKRLLIFEPGFPGDGSTRLEKKYLKKLLSSGFSVWTARHSGTIINGKYADAYINCEKKQKWSAENGQKLLGIKKKFTISDWLEEPFIALSVLSKYFEEIYIVSHSFGSLAALTSLISFCGQNSQKNKKVKRLISLAGTTGRIREGNDPIIKQWRKYLNLKATKEKIIIGSTQGNIEILKKAYTKIHKYGKNIPTSIDLVFVNPWGQSRNSCDELVSPIETIDFISTVNRGTIIIDTTQKGDNADRLAHDMDNLKPETLLSWLNKPINGKTFDIIK